MYLGKWFNKIGIMWQCWVLSWWRKKRREVKKEAGGLSVLRLRSSPNWSKNNFVFLLKAIWLSLCHLFKNSSFPTGLKYVVIIKFPNVLFTFFCKFYYNWYISKQQNLDLIIKFWVFFLINDTVSLIFPLYSSIIVVCVFILN